ncbi:MAG: hypothetical protein OXB93_07100 [Cytophagales bacterium]|nr:hypothetical protein [Cytophagales bacterium]
MEEGSINFEFVRKIICLGENKEKVSRLMPENRKKFSRNYLGYTNDFPSKKMGEARSHADKAEKERPDGLEARLDDDTEIRFLRPEESEDEEIKDRVSLEIIKPVCEKGNTSKWCLKIDGSNTDVSIKDLDWLEKFQNNQLDITLNSIPGCSLKVKLKTITNNQTRKKKYEVVEVYDIKPPPPTQEKSV